jgi:hypothetical protein
MELEVQGKKLWTIDFGKDPKMFSWRKNIPIGK